MVANTFEILSKLPAFASLPDAELKELSEKTEVRQFPKGTVVADQGLTEIEYILVVIQGALELYHRQDNQKKLVQGLKSGGIFGAISILMNAGVTLRTAKAVKDTVCIGIPRNLFSNLCARHSEVYEFFADQFRRRMGDEAYSAIIARAQAPLFISKIVPFSFLPEDEIDTIASSISLVHYPADTLLLLQGQSKVEHLYIIKTGAAERYYEKGNEKILRGVLGEGDIFGGISMLVNNSLAVRTLKTTENTFFFLLPKKIFLEICERQSMFSEYFTNTFGKRMVESSYAEIISRHYEHPGEDLAFFGQTVGDLYHKNLVSCSQNATIQYAALKMKRYRCSSIFVYDPRKKVIGVVTDNDLSRKVIARGLDFNRPVSEIMSSPLITLPANALVFEALLAMMQTQIKHLAITDLEENVVGVLTHRDLLNAQGHYPIFLIRQISTAKKISDITNKHAKLPLLIRGLIKSGAQPANVTRMITTISDAILDRILGFALEKLRRPPVDFAFMILGSEGRKEQTLKTDQDNAIIYADVPPAEAERVKTYFLNLGETVCNWLDEAGYAFCKGGVMAKNPQWCMPLSEWKQQFTKWIHTAEPEALLQASIFFDFRGAYGNLKLIDQLREHLFASLSGWPGFFRHLTENALYFKPPIGFFRNFVVEQKGEHRNQFDIKSAMMPIVDFARIYALKHRLEETNTLERLQLLREEGLLSDSDYEELDQSYSFLMHLRFMRQIRMIVEEQTAPDNYVNPKKLSPIEQTMLKEIFKRLEKCHSRLSFDFIG